MNPKALNPMTGEPWVIDEAGRKALARALRINPNTRRWHAPDIIANVDRVARDHQRIVNLRPQLKDGAGPDIARLRVRGGFRAELLSRHEAIKRNRGRPRLTRESHAVVWALARAWPCRVTLSPRSPFVVALRIILQAAEDADGKSLSAAYGIARRVAATPLPSVGERLEPLVMRDLLIR